MEKYMFLILLSIFMVVGSDPIIESSLNPGCPCAEPNKNLSLVHIKSHDDFKTLHNMWDFTSGKPTMIFAVTEINNTLNIDWNNNTCKPERIWFLIEPVYSFGIIIDKIWEFDDIHDTGIFNISSNHTRKIDASSLSWYRYGLVLEKNEAMINVISKSNIGEIDIKLDLYPYISYATELPHLMHTANSTLWNIALKNMITTRSFNYSRFAIEVIMISTETENSTMKLNIRKGFDDEHTPGVFEIVELLTPQTIKDSNGGFIQYRPVSYTSPNRSVASSTRVDPGYLNITTIPKNNLAYKYFYEENKSFNILTEDFIVTLGSTGDGYFKKHNISIWSFTAGYGRPPSEGFSLLVILILSIGLGIPVILIIIGGIFICTKRHLRNKNTHITLQNEN